MKFINNSDECCFCLDINKDDIKFDRIQYYVSSGLYQIYVDQYVIDPIYNFWLFKLNYFYGAVGNDGRIDWDRCVSKYSIQDTKEKYETVCEDLIRRASKLKAFI